MGADLELAGRRADGTEFPAEITLSAIETEEGQVALAAIRDITERLKAEGTFQAMLDVAPDAMVGVNRDGVIVMANAQTEAVFGYERDALLGEPIEVLVPDHVKGLHPGHRTADLREPRTRPMGAPSSSRAGAQTDRSSRPRSASARSRPSGVPSRSPRSETTRTARKRRRRPDAPGRRRIARTRPRATSCRASAMSFGRR